MSALTVSRQMTQAAAMLQTDAFRVSSPDVQLQTAAGLVTNIATAIGNASIRIQEAAQLTQQASCMPLTPEHKNELLQAISQRCAQGPGNDDGKQYVSHLLELLTQKDWDKMESASSLAIAMLAVCERVNKLGLSTPTEKCCENIAATAAMMWWTTDMPSPAEAYKLCMDTKAYLRRTPVMGPRGPQTYPTDPNGLDQALKVYAYPDPTDPPVARNAPRFSIRFANPTLREAGPGIVLSGVPEI